MSGYRARDTGMAGEEAVSRYLETLGQTIHHRNWRTRRGEIDIISGDADTLYFIEVKTWPRGAAADLDIVLGPKKRLRMIETAKYFLSLHRQYKGMYIQFDVILVSSDPLKDAELRIEHLKDAFSEHD